MATPGTGSDLRRIRVWFGSEVICSHVAEARKAERYAWWMNQKFAGLTFTVDTPPAGGDHGAPLPVEGLWERTVR